MADLDDMEMMECPVCGKKAPREYFPLCSCKQGDETEKKKAGKSRKNDKATDPYDY